MFVVGKVLRPHGIKGEIKVESFMDSPDILVSLQHVFIGNKQYEIERATTNGSFVLYKLAGIDSMNSAESLRNLQIFSPKADLPPCDEGRYYIKDILKSSVFLEKENIGILIDILQYGSADIYVVDTKNGQVMFPFVDGVVEHIDIDNKKIQLNKDKFLQVAVYEN